jgi:hypothetical protein
MLITDSLILAAGVRSTLGQGGRYFRLLETSSPLTVRLGVDHRIIDTLGPVEAGAWSLVKPGERDFDSIFFDSPLAQTVKYVVTDGSAGYDRLFIAIAQALNLNLPGNVAVGVAEGVVLIAASRRKVVFQADSANVDVIALGPVGVTLANSPIVLGPGEIWIEEIASSASWSAISGSAAQTLRILTAA